MIEVIGVVDGIEIIRDADGDVLIRDEHGHFMLKPAQAEALGKLILRASLPSVV